MYDPEIGNPEHGIKPGTSFEELPKDWTSPICRAAKNQFKNVERRPLITLISLNYIPKAGITVKIEDFSGPGEI